MVGFVILFCCVPSREVSWLLDVMFRLAWVFVCFPVSVSFRTQGRSYWSCWSRDFLHFPAMVARLLIGDNNLSRFWASAQFARSSLKSSVLVTATDLDALDHALTKVDERDQVIVSVLTSILMEEVNQDEVGPSAFNVCEAAVSRLVGVCPWSPSCQVLGCFWGFVGICRFFMPQRFLIRCQWVFCLLPVFPGSSREVCSASLVQRQLPGDLRRSCATSTPLPCQPAPLASLRHWFYHVRELWVL